jgi:four helix bundle protein
MQLDMERTDWNPKKPYDLRERLFEFGCLVIRLVQSLHTRGPVAMKLSEQILKAGTSAPANYEESDDGTGNRDKAAKRKIALRELKEVRLRMRMLRRCDFLTASTIPSSRKAMNWFGLSPRSFARPKAAVEPRAALKVEPYWQLAVGSWEWLVVGRWELGVYEFLLSP